MRLVIASAALASALGGCAPSVDGPAERQHARDGTDGTTLATQLRALPGVVRAEVALHRPVADPLGTAAPATPSLSLVLVVDDRADRARLTTAATQLARALAPTAPATIVVEVGAIRPTLARVGPFTVEERSKQRLKTVLALAFVAIAGLAAWIALRYRRGSKAQ